MIETLAGTGEGGVDDLTATDLLAALRERKAVEDRAAADQLDLAARWADLHPPESIHAAGTFTIAGFDREEPIAGEGCPTVGEFCIPELGTVLGISTVSAKRLIGHALELRHRLPRLWAAVQSGPEAVVAGTRRRRGHHPLDSFAHRRGRRLGRRPGLSRRRLHRTRTARPTRRRDDHAARSRGC